MGAEFLKIMVHEFGRAAEFRAELRLDKKEGLFAKSKHAVAVVPGEDADRAVAALRAHPLGEQAAVIGHVRSEQPGIVQLKTAFGGTRIVDLLVGDPLPRIC